MNSRSVLPFLPDRSKVRSSQLEKASQAASALSILSDMNELRDANREIQSEKIRSTTGTAKYACLEMPSPCAGSKMRGRNDHE